MIEGVPFKDLVVAALIGSVFGVLGYFFTRLVVK